VTLISLLVGFLWLYLLLHHVKKMIAVTLVAIPVILITLSATALGQAVRYQSTAHDPWTFQYLLALSGVLLTCAALVSGFMISKRHQISQTMEITQLASDILKANPAIFSLSLGILCVHITFTIFWLWIFVTLFHASFSTDLSWAGSLSGPSPWMITYFILMYFWTSAILQNIEKVTISGVVGDWYFNQ